MNGMDYVNTDEGFKLCLDWGKDRKLPWILNDGLGVVDVVWRDGETVLVNTKEKAEHIDRHWWGWQVPGLTGKYIRVSWSVKYSMLDGQGNASVDVNMIGKKIPTEYLAKSGNHGIKVYGHIHNDYLNVLENKNLDEWHLISETVLCPPSGDFDWILFIFHEFK